VKTLLLQVKSQSHLVRKLSFLLFKFSRQLFKTKMKFRLRKTKLQSQTLKLQDQLQVRQALAVLLMELLKDQHVMLIFAVDMLTKKKTWKKRKTETLSRYVV